MKKAIESILYFDLNPLRPDKRGEDYYRPAYRELGSVAEEFDAHYRITFDAPVVSSKVKYLAHYIDNAITTQLNELFRDNGQISKNWVLYKRKKLYESVCTYLSEAQSVIKRNNLSLDDLLILQDYSTTPQLNESTYIFHYLTLALIRCYMEFQQHFYGYIEKENKLVSIEEFFVQVLQKRLPSKVEITEIPHIEIPTETKAEPRQKKKRAKTPNVILSFKYDCTPGKRLDNIKAFYEELVDRKLISKDEPYTNFKHLLLAEEVKTPITWIGGKGELVYLFRYLVNEKAILHPSEGNTIWDVVVHCFVDKDGNCYDNLNLGGQQKPCAKRITKLEDIANKTLL